jgi:flagellar hook-associated protein 2
MTTAIQLGNFSTQNGKTVITGSSSGGIDTEGLMKALTEAKRLPAVQLEERIDQNTKMAAAYSEMEDILSRFQSAADFLRNPPGVNNATDNIFKYRNATVTNNGAQAGSNYLSVTASPGAVVGNYQVTVDQLATYNVKLTNTFTLTDTNGDTLISTSDAAVGAGLPFAAGPMSLGASGTIVNLNNGDSLGTVAAKINAVSNLSKVSATIIKVADGDGLCTGNKRCGCAAYG